MFRYGVDIAVESLHPLLTRFCQDEIEQSHPAKLLLIRALGDEEESIHRMR